MNDQRHRQDDDEPLAAKARALFDDSVEQLDAATLSQLNQNRQRALERAAKTPSFAGWQHWVPATGIAAAAVFAVVLWTGKGPVEGLAPVSTASDLEIILEVDDFEMLEDLEFYSWIDLAEQTDSNVG
jgi:hypothetical protein